MSDHTSPVRRGYTRLETDAELLARIRAAHPGAGPWGGETVDNYAARMGMARKIVEGT